MTFELFLTSESDSVSVGTAKYSPWLESLQHHHPNAAEQDVEIYPNEETNRKISALLAKKKRVKVEFRAPGANGISPKKPRRILLEGFRNQ